MVMESTAGASVRSHKTWLTRRMAARAARTARPRRSVGSAAMVLPPSGEAKMAHRRSSFAVVPPMKRGAPRTKSNGVSAV